MANNDEAKEKKEMAKPQLLKPGKYPNTYDDWRHYDPCEYYSH